MFSNFKIQLYPTVHQLNHKKDLGENPARTLRYLPCILLMGLLLQLEMSRWQVTGSDEKREEEMSGEGKHVTPECNRMKGTEKKESGK